MADRRLIVGEFDPQEPDNGKLFGLQPNNATGVAIPAFRFGTSRPTVGDAPGVAFFHKTTGIASVWDGNQWGDIAKPDIAFYPDDNTLLADNPSPNTVALSEATGNLFVRVGMEWLAIGLRVYPTQAGMVGSTPPNGTLGYAVDTGEFAIRTGGAWAALTNQGVNVGNTAPPTPLAGNQWFDTNTSTLMTWNGTQWMPPSTGLPVGTIITHASVTPPVGYLLCDGSAIPTGTQYDALKNMIGANVPDLTDQFIRGAANQNQIDGFTKHQDTTRRPRNDFTVHASGNTGSNGNHYHSFTRHGYNTDGGWSGGDALWTVSKGGSYTVRTNTTGNHHHSVSIDGTVNGGGDTETAPAHVKLAYHIKY